MNRRGDLKDLYLHTHIHTDIRSTYFFAKEQNDLELHISQRSPYQMPKLI